MANCQFMQSDIQLCQQKGKIITLSLGGASGAALTSKFSIFICLMNCFEIDLVGKVMRMVLRLQIRFGRLKHEVNDLIKAEGVYGVGTFSWEDRLVPDRLVLLSLMVLIWISK
jgi:hypothetical protein